MLITVCFVVATSAPCFGLQRPSTGRTWVTFFIQNFVVDVHQQNYIYSTEILKHNQEYINVEIILDVHLFFLLVVLLLLNLQSNLYTNEYVFRKCFVFVLAKWSVIYSGPAFIIYAHVRPHFISKINATSPEGGLFRPKHVREFDLLPQNT